MNNPPLTPAGRRLFRALVPYGCGLSNAQLNEAAAMIPDPTRDALQRIVAEVEASNTIRLTLATTVLAIAREALAAADNDQHIRIPRDAAQKALYLMDWAGYEDSATPAFREAFITIRAALAANPTPEDD